MLGEFCDGFVELRGDRCFGDDATIKGGIGFIEKLPVTLIAYELGWKNEDGMCYGLRKSQRLIRQAKKFGRSVVFLIDVKGPYEESLKRSFISQKLVDIMLQVRSSEVNCVVGIIQHAGEEQIASKSSLAHHVLLIDEEEEIHSIKMKILTMLNKK
ncbi:MAG: hypothetical protein ACRCWY_05705 [Cellulosilyticaceae bacterium]